MLERIVRAAKTRLGHATGMGVGIPSALAAAMDDPARAAKCLDLIERSEVHPRIVQEAESLLLGGKLHRFADSKLMFHRGTAAEKLCFYAASRTLAHASGERRTDLLRSLAELSPLSALFIPKPDGVLLVPPLDWTVLQDAVTEAKECFAVGTNSRTDRKKFMGTARLPNDPMRSKIMALAAHPSVLRLVGTYLDGLPILYRINLIKSENTEIEDNSSQFHHLDPEGIRQVKIFLLVSDVDDDTGPLHLLKASASDEVQVKIGYRQRRLADTEVNAIVGSERLVKCVGPTGTLAIGDTSRCFHFGSRPGKHQRFVVMLQYITPFCEEFPIDAQAVGGKFAALSHGTGELNERLFGLVR